jgi:hypothetical protein
MRSILFLLILVMLGISGKGQSITALPDSVLSQCCLEVTLLNGNVTTVDFIFIQYMTRDGSGTKIFVEYAPNFGGIQWETQIRIQDDFDEVIERSKFIMLPFTVATTDYAINRNWIANIETNATTGGTWIYGRFGTPTKRKFSAVEDYSTMKALLLACRPRAIIVAENGLYAEGDTVRLGGVLIEPTRVELDGYPITFIDTLAKQSFGIGEGNVSGYFGDTIGYFARRVGKFRQMITQGNRYNEMIIRDTINANGDYAQFYQGLYTGNKPYMFLDATNSEFDGKFSRVSIDADSVYLDNRPYLSSIDAYTRYSVAKSGKSAIGVKEGEPSITGSGVELGAYGYGIGGGASEYLFMRTKAVDNSTATVGQFLQLKNVTTGEVDFASVDLSPYLLKSDTAAMLANYPSTVGWGILKSTKTIRADTTKLATLFDISGFPSGSGTTNRIPIWTASNTLGSSNALYNSTTKRWTWDSPSVLELPMGTDAQRPSPATTSDFWYNTTNGLEIYNGSDWFFVNPWKQSTSSSNVFLNSGSAIVNSSSILNSNYKFQVNGGALYSGATFTSNQTNQAALDIRNLSITAQPGTTHGVWGLNIEGAMSFNTGNQTYGGLRIATTSNATTSHIVLPIDISFSAVQLGNAKIINTNASGGSEWLVAGGGSNAPERVVMRSPNGGTSNSMLPGYNYLSTSGNFGWVMTGQNSGIVFHSNIAGIRPQDVNPTMIIRDSKVLIGRRVVTTPTATLEITGEGIGNSTTSFLVQNSGRANNMFRILDNGLIGIGLSTPLQELDINGDLRVRDSVDLDVTPAHAAITGILTRDATGWVGRASVSGGLSYSSGILTSTWLKPSLEAVSVNINQGRINKLRFNQDSAFFHLKNGVIFLQHPTEKDVVNYGLPQVIITSDTTALWDKSGAVVSIGSVLGSGQRAGYGYTMVGSYTQGVSNDYGGYFSSAYGYDVAIDSTIKTVAIGAKITAKRVTDCSAFGTYITYSRGVANSHSVGRNNTINRSFGFILGEGLTTRFANEFLYGSSFGVKHSFFGNGLSIGADSSFQYTTSNKVLRLGGYGSGTKEASDLSKTQSTYIAGFATDGTVLDYRITRDTSTSNADFTVTSTLLSSCQELFISAEVTSSATDTVNIILPTPSATYKNNKVYVFGDDDSSTQWVATKSVNATGLYYSNGGVKPTATNYAAVTTTTGVSGVTYVWICTRRNSGTWNWVLIRQ